MTITGISFAEELEVKGRTVRRHMGYREYRTDIGTACRRFYAERPRNDVVIMKIHQIHV